MVKRPTKPQSITNTLQNSPNLNSKLDSELSKTRQQINQANYQKNKDQIKEKRRVRYQQQKAQEELTTKQQQAKYCGAEAIKILMSFKEYIELNQQKHKLWLDFQWTLKECAKNIHGVIDIMRLRELSDYLIKDYEETAKKELKKSKNWNSLDYDQQQKLIRYWGYEKARIEDGYLAEEERLERQSQQYLKEIESAKFHEERGKINCECYQCVESQRIQSEIKEQLLKENKTKKEQCPECKKWVKELDEEAGVCKSCTKKYE